MAVKLSAGPDLLAQALAALAPHLPAGAALPTGPFAPTGPTEAHPLPALACLPRLAALACPATRDLTAAAVAAAPALHWRQTYDGSDVAAGFLDRYGWAELLGPYGPWPSATARLGLLLLGPDTHYPPHAHAAEELYFVLAGTASWQKGAEPWRPVPPASTIHHTPHLPHAMRTTAEPLLAMYLWWGEDLAVHARMVPPHDC
ncbi:MAG: dimethylsulfonioproprionate lyase family protein [Geminicoccaceae bacterium]